METLQRFVNCPWCEKPLASHMLASHKKLHCPKRPALVRALERLDAAAPPAALPEVPTPPPSEVLRGLRPPVPCACGCGQPVAQLSEKPKRYLNTTHYEKHRYLQSKGTEEAATPSLSKEEKLDLEMAPIRLQQAELAAKLARTEREVLSSRWPYPGMLELLEVKCPLCQSLGAEPHKDWCHVERLGALARVGGSGPHRLAQPLKALLAQLHHLGQ